MTSVKPFYIEQLQSNFPGLERFFHKSEAISKIETLSKDPKFVREPTSSIQYFGRWRVAWITFTHPFYSLLSAFSSSMAFFSYSLWMPKIGRIFTVLSHHLVRDWHQLCCQREFDSPLMVPAYNIHQLFTWDFYNHGDVPYRYVRGEAIKPLTYQYTVLKEGVDESMDAFYKTLKKVQKEESWATWLWNLRFLGLENIKEVTKGQFFEKYKNSTHEAIGLLREKYSSYEIDEPINALYKKLKITEERLKTLPNISLFSNKGSCRGASLWFVFLYLRTKHLFHNPSKQLTAIAKEFAFGVPRQAALLQAFDDSDDLLKLERKEMSDHTVSLYELDHNRKRAEAKINKLDVGVYRVGVYKHSLVYLKISKNEHYIWDPEFGLYPMDGEEMLQMILKHHHVPGNSNSQIYFHKYESKEPYEEELV